MRSRTPPSASSAQASSRRDPVVLADRAYPAGRIALFTVISIAGCATDLLTKQWVFQWRGLPRPDNEWWLWEPYIGIETVINIGALFGMGGGYGHLSAGL